MYLVRDINYLFRYINLYISIIFRENNIDSMENSMNKTLKHLDTWLSLNKLTINLSKTNYLIFNNNKAKVSIILNR